MDTNPLPNHNWYQPDTNHVLDQVVVHSVDKIHVLVITTELT